MTATRVRLSLDFRDSDHFRAESHSFANLMNVVHAELQLLDRMCLPSPRIGPAISLCETAVKSFRNRQRAQGKGPDLELFRSTVEDATGDLVPRAGHEHDAAEALQIIGEVIDDAELRVEELLARYEVPRSWVLEEPDRIRATILETAGDADGLVITAPEAANVPIGMLHAVGRVVRDLRRITDGVIRVEHQPGGPGSRAAPPGVSIHAAGLTREAVPDFSSGSVHDTVPVDPLEASLTLLYYCARPGGTVYIHDSGSPLVSISFDET
jgi:hypothetical protein